MDGDKHELNVQAATSPWPIDCAEKVAIALLVPRVALGWMSLQLGWRAMHQAPFPPLNAGWLLALGLTLSGIALVLGLLTGPSAFVSGTLSASVWEQGNAVTASVVFALALLMVFAWRTAGQVGLDRWLLPYLGLTRYRGALVTRGNSRTDRRRGKNWVAHWHVCGQGKTRREEVVK